MQREAPFEETGSGKVLHVVGCVTDEVFSFLGPATTALARAGREQAVVLIDELRHRHHVARFHESAELVLTPATGNPFSRWKAVFTACRDVLASGPLQAVHLHGVLPCLVGAHAVRAAGVQVPIFFSPHASRSMSVLRSLGTLGLVSVRPLLQAARGAAIVNTPDETAAFERWKPAELVESPVADLYFQVDRHEARNPLVVTGGRTQSARNAELFSQLAVLLSDEDLGVSFNWIGTVDKVSRMRLNAAGVGVFDVTGDAECASRLAAGWMYLAPGGTRGFPLFLVGAMAAGLPCIAFDCPQHREVIRHGETGFLCRSERDMIETIAMLIDDKALRLRTGDAARAEAAIRFGESEFGAKLLAAYALPR